MKKECEGSMEAEAIQWILKQTELWKGIRRCMRAHGARSLRLQRKPHLEMPPLTKSVQVRVETPQRECGEQRGNGRRWRGSVT